MKQMKTQQLRVGVLLSLCALGLAGQGYAAVTDDTAQDESLLQGTKSDTETVRAQEDEWQAALRARMTPRALRAADDDYATVGMVNAVKHSLDIWSTNTDRRLESNYNRIKKIEKDVSKQWGDVQDNRINISLHDSRLSSLENTVKRQNVQFFSANFDANDTGGNNQDGNRNGAAHAKQSIAIGSASVDKGADGGIGIGADTHVDILGKNSVAIGKHAYANEEDVVSVGNDAYSYAGRDYAAKKRRIIHVAKGKKDTDAVNVSQLNEIDNKKANLDASNLKTDNDKAAWKQALGIDKLESGNATITNLNTQVNKLEKTVLGDTVTNGNITLPYLGVTTNVGYPMTEKAHAEGGASVALGYATFASANGIAAGVGSHAGIRGSAFGYKSKADTHSTALGVLAHAKKDSSIAIGAGNGHDDIYTSEALSDGAIAVGAQTEVGEMADKGIAIGIAAKVKGKSTYSVAVGAFAETDDAEFAAAFGGVTKATERATALGTYAEATGYGSTVVGNGGKAYTHGSVALGLNAVADVAKGEVGYAFTADNATFMQIIEAAGQKAKYDELNAVISPLKDEYNGLVKAYQQAESDSPEEAQALQELNTWKQNHGDFVKALAERRQLEGAWQSSEGAVSIGNATEGITRQITNLAAGSKDTDAVNVAQLKTMANVPATFSTVAKGAQAGDPDTVTKVGTLPLSKLALEYADGLTVTAQEDKEKNKSMRIGVNTDTLIQNINNSTTKITNIDLSNNETITKLTKTVEDSKKKYFSVNDKEQRKPDSPKGSVNDNNDGAIGGYSIAVGYSTEAKGNYSTAFGNAAANGNRATSMGWGSVAGGDNATAYGADSYATGEESSAFGDQAHALGLASTSIGSTSIANEVASTSIGYKTFSGNKSTAIGGQAYAFGNNSIALGLGSYVGDTDFRKAYQEQQDPLYYYSEVIEKDTAKLEAYKEKFKEQLKDYNPDKHAYTTKLMSLIFEDLNKKVENGTALGNYTTVGVSGGVAVGYKSKATRDKGVMGYNLTDKAWKNVSDLLAGADFKGKENIQQSYQAWVDANTAVSKKYAEWEQATSTEDKDRLAKEWAELDSKKKEAYKEFRKTVAAWQSGEAAVSIGNEETGMTRQLTGVAAGSADTDAVNVAQLKALHTKVEANAMHYVSVNPKDEARTGTPSLDNFRNDGAVGGKSVAIGVSAKSDGQGAVAIGTDTQANAVNSVALGSSAQAAGQASSALGNHARAFGDDSMAVGTNAKAKEIGSVAFGKDTKTMVRHGVAVGTGSVADTEKGAIGYTLTDGVTTLDEALTAIGKKDRYDELKAKTARAELIYNGLVSDYQEATPGTEAETKAKQKLDQWLQNNADMAAAIAEKRSLEGAWRSGLGAVSVGNAGSTRQITNLAAGSEDTDAVNVAQLKALANKVNEKGDPIHYFSVKHTDTHNDSNYKNDGAKAFGSVAIGANTSTHGIYGSAIGTQALSIGGYSQAWGYYATATVEDGINQAAYDALSEDEKKNYVYKEMKVRGEDKSLYYRVKYPEYTNDEFMALDEQTRTHLAGDLGYGYSSSDKKWIATPRAVAIGHLSKAVGSGALAIGNLTEAHGVQSTAVGVQAKTEGSFSFAAGDRAHAKGEASVAIGYKAAGTGEWSTAVGALTKATGEWGTAIGLQSEATGEKSVAVGSQTEAKAYGAQAMGYKAVASGKFSISAGTQATADGEWSIAQGLNSKAVGDKSIAVGAFANATAEGAVALGGSSVADVAEGKVGYAFAAAGATLEQTLEAAGQKAKYDTLNAVVNPLKAEYDGLVAAYQQAESDSPEEAQAKQALDTWKQNHGDFVKALAERTLLESTWKSGAGAVSVGNAAKGITRQITNLAAGTEDTDAVNVAQLKVVNKKADDNATAITNITKTDGLLSKKADVNAGNVTGDDVKAWQEKLGIRKAGDNNYTDVHTSITNINKDITNLKGGFTIQDANTTVGKAGIKLGETKKDAITFKAVSEDKDGATSALTAKVADDKSVTYTLNTKKLKEDLGITAKGVGTMSSWKLKATSDAAGTEAEEIKNGNEVTFGVSEETGETGLKVTRKGATITYGVDKDKLVTNIAGDIINQINNTTTTTTPITNISAKFSVQGSETPIDLTMTKNQTPNVKFEGETDKIDVAVDKDGTGAKVTVKANAKLGESIDISNNTSITNVKNDITNITKTDGLLSKKADIDAKNVEGNDLKAWQEKLGIRKAGDNNYTDVHTSITNINKDITNLKGGFTIQDANANVGTADIKLGETKKDAITFKAATEDKDGATSALTAKVGTDKSVTYTLNTKKLKEDLGIDNLGKGTMSSWKLRAQGDTDSETIGNGNDVTFGVSEETGETGLKVTRKGTTITYGVDKDVLVSSITNNIIAEISKSTGAQFRFYSGGSVNADGKYVLGTGTTWSTGLNNFRLAFGDGLEAKEIVGADNQKYTLVTLKDKGGSTPGTPGAKGDDGKSAFDIWKEENKKPNATKAEFLEALKGADGTKGQDGKSVYDTWKENPDNAAKTKDDFLKEMKGKDGTDGKDGKSAYQVWKEYQTADGTKPNADKTEADFMEYMKGKGGAGGTDFTVKTDETATAAKPDTKVDAQNSTFTIAGDKTNITTSIGGNNTVKVELKKDIKVDSVDAGGVKIDKNGIDMSGKTIKNVAPGKEAGDVATVGQLQSVAKEVSKYGQAIGTLRDESREGDALNAALAALKPLDFDPLQRSQIMAGVSTYKGKQAVALGLAHYSNEDTLFHAGVSYAGSSDLMANAGISWRFGDKSDRDERASRNVRLPQYAKGPMSSVYVMQDEMAELKAENASLRAENEEIKKQVEMLMKHAGLKA